MESKGERMGGGSVTAICKLYFSAWGITHSIEQRRAAMCEQKTETARLRKMWKAGRERECERKQKEGRKKELGFKWWPEWFDPFSLAPWLGPLSQPLSPSLNARINDRCLAEWGTFCLSSRHRRNFLPHKSGAHSHATANICYIFQSLHYFLKGQPGTMQRAGANANECEHELQQKANSEWEISNWLAQ